MRPSTLYPLFAPLTSLSGLGPRLADRLQKVVGGARILDLLFTLPVGILDRRPSPPLATASAGQRATYRVTILSHTPSHNKKQPYRIRVATETGENLSLNFFAARAQWLQKAYPRGESRVVSGRLERFNNEWQMPHPERTGKPEDYARIACLEPVYPMTAGLSPLVVQKAISAALKKLPDLPEWLDPALVAREAWPSFTDALKTLHAAQDPDTLAPTHPARRRLAYDECLANQFTLAQLREKERMPTGVAHKVNGPARIKLRRALPFTLTAAQENAMAQIDADMAAPTRMVRLLQGDVGSGKTLVALMAALNTLETGRSAALLAPTEILARQHAETLARYLTPLGHAPLLLLGKSRGQGGKERSAILEQLASGKPSMVIGTHALLQDDVSFGPLSLVIVDEQHRFGVQQRLKLSTQYPHTDLLVMTATPIPRSLALTFYGDMDVTALTEKPAGRQPIQTRLMATERIPELIDGLSRHFAKNEQAYWVCPLIEESDETALTAAETRFASLHKKYGDEVALLHGQMKPQEKEKVMESFLRGLHRLLVATTVIEVGVDVPNATLMIIEHAERFGLAQLHQLRGRVGRGNKPSACVLLYQPPLSEMGTARLKLVRETEDGFHIAEEDLRLRGPGEILGHRQSGLPNWRFVNMACHASLLPMARDDARYRLQHATKTKAGESSLSYLLYLFDQDAGAETLNAG